MPLFTPNYHFSRVSEITPAFLQSIGIRGLLLDVDNTLSLHGAPDPETYAVRWLQEMNAAGIPAVIVSNNRESRVAPFADKLELPYVCRGAKPLPGGFRRAQRKLSMQRGELAVIGDQLFTDIAGGNLAGMTTLLVDPIQPESGCFFRLKRALERPLLARFERRKRQKG